MTISANLNDKIAGCIIESTAVPGQPAVAVVNPDGSSVGGGGAVSSVFSRTGAVVAASGDYTVGQVTGAAPLAGLTATITGTTAGALYTSYKVSSGTFVFTLPVPVSGGWTTVTNCGSGVVTIAHNSTEVIFGLGLGSSGASSIALGAIGATVTLESDGSNWYITAGFVGAPYAQASGATTSVLNITWTAMALASSVFTGYGITLLTNGFIVPIKGTYVAYASVAFNTAASGEAGVALAKNGTKQGGPPQITLNNTFNVVVQATSIFQCAASDQITIQAYQSSGGTLSTVQVVEAGIYFVGPQ